MQSITVCFIIIIYYYYSLTHSLTLYIYLTSVHSLTARGGDREEKRTTRAGGTDAREGRCVDLFLWSLYTLHFSYSSSFSLFIFLSSSLLSLPPPPPRTFIPVTCSYHKRSGEKSCFEFSFIRIGSKRSRKGKIGNSLEITEGCCLNHNEISPGCEGGRRSDSTDGV